MADDLERIRLDQELSKTENELARQEEMHQRLQDAHDVKQQELEDFSGASDQIRHSGYGHAVKAGEHIGAGGVEAAGGDIVGGIGHGIGAVREVSDGGKCLRAGEHYGQEAATRKEEIGGIQESIDDMDGKIGRSRRWLDELKDKRQELEEMGY